jgi:hypothetical protein
MVKHSHLLISDWTMNGQDERMTARTSLSIASDQAREETAFSLPHATRAAQTSPGDRYSWTCIKSYAWLHSSTHTLNLSPQAAHAMG